MVYLLTTLIPEDGDDASVEQLRKRNKWENDDYVCRGSILKVMEQYNELLGILGRFTQWNGYLRKGRKTKPKRQNRTRNGKSMVKTKSRQSPSLKKSTKVNPDKSKVKPEDISEEK
ncbi:hypothetical protein Tco_1431206 [Tanacetum coccineum]